MAPSHIKSPPTKSCPLVAPAPSSHSKQSQSSSCSPQPQPHLLGRRSTSFQSGSKWLTKGWAVPTERWLSLLVSARLSLSLKAAPSYSLAIKVSQGENNLFNSLTHATCLPQPIAANWDP